jgi:hypothetical protein
VAGFMVSEVRALLRVAVPQSTSCRFKLRAEGLVRRHGDAGGQQIVPAAGEIAAVSFKTSVMQPVVPETLLGLSR